MTTVLAVTKDGKLAMGADGQITHGETIVKHTASKIRKLYDNQVLVGFAGATADAITLLERFEASLKKWQGNIKKASIELAKEWRSDKVLRRLQSVLLVADKNTILLVSGSGDVIEPEENVSAIGSGAGYALAAAKALLRHTNLSAKEIVQEALKIVSKICIYTNDYHQIETLE